jgi:hypothetical protein
LAINHYSIEIQSDGGFMVKKSASYDSEKIKKEGFYDTNDSSRIRRTNPESIE